MTGSTKSFTDWLWTIIGIVGVICIAVAVYLFARSDDGSNVPTTAEDLMAAARESSESGRSLFEAKDFPGAVAALEEAARLAEEAATLTGNRSDAPFESDVSNRWGEALRETGDYEKAVQCWARSRRLNTSNLDPCWNLARHFEASARMGPAYQMYRTLLALHDEPVPQSLIEKVRTLEAGLADAREEELDGMRGRLRANPADVQVFGALLINELIATRVPEDARGTAAIRAALLAVGASFADLDQLLASQRGAVEARPQSVVDRAGLGNLLLLSGKTDEAREVFTKALELSAPDVSSIFGAALCDALSDTPDLRRLETRVRTLAANPLSWLLLGAAALEAGEIPLAQNALRTARVLAEGLPEAYRLLALSFTEPGVSELKEKALRGYRRLLPE